MRYRAVAVVALLCLATCSPGPQHIADATLFGVHFRVTLTPAHAYLAGYTRQVEATRDGHTEKRELFADSGGYAWVVIRTRAGQLEVVDFGGLQYAVPIGGAPASPQYLGRFDFDAQRRYSFIPASVDAHDPSTALNDLKP